MITENLVYVILMAYAIAISAEALYSWKKNLNLYNISDTLINFFFGISAVLVRVGTKFIWLKIWLYIYKYSIFKIPENLYSWVALFFVNEFVYYWFHRISHEWRPLWAIHVNHHSSELMNFSTATRTPIFNFLLHNLFWIPLPLIGFHPNMVFVIAMVSFVLTFFQHTQLVPKIKWLDYFVNTPTHHRVHHASNAKYIDKNYGNILIIFDRMFGTFEPETEKPVYGLTKNVRSKNLVVLIFHEWVALWHSFKNRRLVPFKLWRWDRQKKIKRKLPRFQPQRTGTNFSS